MGDQIVLIYEDKNFLALNKPANLLVHPVRTSNSEFLSPQDISRRETTSKKPTLVDWVLKRYPAIKNVGDPPTSLEQANLRPGIVHRLDKDTSGVILVAKNQDYFNYLKHLFQTHQIKKTYLTLVYGELKPKIGVIKKPIRLRSGTIKRTVWKGKIEKEAITEYRVLKYFKHKFKQAKYNRLWMSTDNLLCFSFLRVTPKTGRTHQIRVHLSSVGHPVVGDPLYGPKINPFDLKRLFLHAESLEFSQEDGKRIKIEAELPNELKEIIKNLKISKRLPMGSENNIAKSSR